MILAKSTANMVELKGVAIWNISCRDFAHKSKFYTADI
jgi:hypothetical protein